MKSIVEILKAATKKLVVPKAEAPKPEWDHLNAEGAPSYYRSLKEQVVQVLTTGTLGGTFYASGEMLAKEALEVLTKARTECPDFLARALVWARQKGFAKTLPVLGLVVLSAGRGRTRALFEAVFPCVVLIPDDVRAFIALCVSGLVPGRKGLGGVAARAVRAWLGGLSEYHAVKYGSAASTDVTLRDAFRLTHPRPAHAALAERFGWLVSGVEKLGDDPALNPQIRAFEALKRSATEEEQRTLIREGRLPYEVVVPAVKATTPAIWTQLLRQAPYLNLLRNLATFTRHGVFTDEANVRYACERLTDPKAVERSRVLPFRFFDAWKRYAAEEGSVPAIAHAIRAALELSFVNVPPFGDRTVAIGTDVSGSMDGNISEKGTTRFVDVAGVFTGALFKRCGEGKAITLPFQDEVITGHGLSAADDILVTAEKVMRLVGGGTAVGAPIEHLLRSKMRVDVFIGVTDSEEWAYGHGYQTSGSFLNLWRRYRAEVAPEAKAFLVTIAPHRDAVAPVHEPDVHFIYGWSSAVLGYIGLELTDGASQIREIEAMDLDTAFVHTAEPEAEES